MAKILDNNSITGNIQKIVEAPAGYIINGHYYDKNQMIPKPFKLFPTLGDIQDISMSKKLLLNQTYTNHNKTQGDTIVVDRYDPTISYVWTVSVRSNAPKIMKIKENNGEVSLLNSVSQTGNPTSYPLIRAYCGQDMNYIYYLMSTGNAWNEYFVKIDKVSLIMTIIDSFGAYAWGSNFKETATHIYYGNQHYYGTVTIKRYNKTTAVLDTLPVSPRSGSVYFSTCCSSIISTSDTEFYSYTVFQNTTTNKFEITRYKFDTTKSVLADICTETSSAITWGSVTQLPSTLGSNTTFHYEPFITTTEDKKRYLNIAVYEHCASSTAANLPLYGIYTFLIDIDADTLTFKSFVQPTTDYFRGFVGLKDSTFLVCASPTTCIFMNFDITNEKFVITDSITNQPTHVGIDQSENIWIVNAISEVDYLNPFVPTTINVKYENSAYKYEGTDVTTYCTVNCQNYSGSYISTNLQLTLKGNGVFTSNGSKVISVSTLTTGDLQIPIKITGAGSLTIYPQLIM
jgi:hypothetical protein